MVKAALRSSAAPGSYLATCDEFGVLMGAALSAAAMSEQGCKPLHSLISSLLGG